MPGAWSKSFHFQSASQDSGWKPFKATSPVSTTFAPEARSRGAAKPRARPQSYMGAGSELSRTRERHGSEVSRSGDGRGTCGLEID